MTSGAPRRPDESKWKYHLRKLFTLKSLTSVDVDTKTSSLVKALSYFDLVMLGMGAIIGSGIFVLTGRFLTLKNEVKKINLI